MKTHLRLIPLIQVASLAWGAHLSAQTVPYVAPTPAECEAAVQALNSGNHNASAWNRLGGCGVVGGNALGQALRAAGAETDSVYLLALYSTASSIKDSAVFHAGLAMAGTTSATPASRIIAFLVGLSQVMPGTGIQLSTGLASLWTSGVGSGCPLTTYPTARTFASTTFLSGEAPQLLAGKADEVRKSSAPAVVKNFAACIRRTLESRVPISVSPLLISSSYVCGNRFRVENHGTDWLSLTWTMEKWSDTGAFQVAPNGSFTVTTRSVGSIRFYQNGVLLFARQNGGVPC